MFGGFESTCIHDGQQKDVLENTMHLMHWRTDLQNLLNQDIRNTRYPIPWHRIESVRGQFDFSCIDGPIRFMREHGITPVLDPLHHVSFPQWLVGGFMNEHFPEFYLRFIQEISRQYPWAARWTLYNEPLATTCLCTLLGTWIPNLKDSSIGFATMVLSAAKTIALTHHWLKQNHGDYEHWYVDTCEYHQALDLHAKTIASEYNERRFLFLDLILGMVNQHHPWHHRLAIDTAAHKTLQWLRDNPASIDVLGLDYYEHCDLEWQRHPDGRITSGYYPKNPRGFYSIAQDYLYRYRLPIWLSETNIRGAWWERLIWLKYMSQECRQLAQQPGVNFKGFCWFPSIDSTDWKYACTQSTCIIDPQGLWMLSTDRTCRVGGMLPGIYGKLGNTITPSDIPAYIPSKRFMARYRGYAKFTNEWQWLTLYEPEPTSTDNSLLAA